MLYLYKCVDGVLRIVWPNQVVRPEGASCPLDPSIFSTVLWNRPFSLFDCVSKSALGSHPPPIVPTWPKLGPDNANFAEIVVQSWSR